MAKPKANRPKDPKTCVICRNDFWIRGDESLCHFERRQTCGPFCAGELIKRTKAAQRNPNCEQELTIKCCEVCKRLFVRDAGQSYERFKERRCCTKKCGGVLSWRIRQGGRSAPEGVLHEIGNVAKESQQWLRRKLI